MKFWEKLFIASTVGFWTRPKCATARGSQRNRGRQEEEQQQDDEGAGGDLCCGAEMVYWWR